MRCQSKHFKDDLKAAWDIVFQIMEGFDSHHGNYNPKTFANRRSQIATKNSENAEILKTHFQKVFNNQTGIVEEIKQRPIAFNLECAPMNEEVRNAHKTMKNNTAPGLMGITTDMLKNLPDKGIMLLTSFIQQFWDDNDCDFEQWHKMKLSMLYKGKGNMQDPHNWHGICLKETSVKIVSAIIANRLLKKSRNHKNKC